MPVISTDSDSGLMFNAVNENNIIKPGVYIGGISMPHESNHLVNLGFVYGEEAVDLTGGYGSITNTFSGEIEGPVRGIVCDGDFGHLINDGVIHGGDGGVYNSGSSFDLVNSGTIEANFAGVELGNSDNEVANAGVIRSGKFGISFVDDGSGKISNSGLISGASASIQTTYASYNVIIQNSGTLDGDVLLAGGTNRVTNSGTIIGDVNLGAGGVYDGRTGTLTGTVLGGTRADKIFAGDDGETLGGGKGHDRLVGGAGADTFAFASYNTADTDVIKRFTVAQDLIQLDHTVFTHLVADVTPTFAIGTTASSATDFLFYNSGTGNLYYDVDGSKTAHDPYLVANVGPGLKLTASNFSVV